MRQVSPKRAMTAVLAPLALTMAALLTPSSAVGAPTERLPLSLCAPDQNAFTLAIDNPFNPLPVRQRWVYSGREQGQTIGLQITVLNKTESFYSGQVKTRVVEELEWEDADGDGFVDRDEFVIERSLNYYAQTQDNPGTPENEGGTVCYFGEDVDIFHEDGTVTHEGAWRADAADDHAPGIFMPALHLLAVGTGYQQEVAPGTAEDEAEIVRVGSTVRVPAGTFSDTITVRDFNPLDGSRGTKVYARNVGLVVDGPLDLVRYSAPLNPNP
jgi:hypothetical protein